MASITTRAEVLTYLGKASPTDAENALVDMLLPLAESSVQDHVGYSISQATYTQLFPNIDMNVPDDREYAETVGDKVVFNRRSSFNKIALPELPVRSITEVREDSAAYGGQGSGDFGSGTVLTAGTDYFLDIDQSGMSRTGFLVRIGTTWPSRRRTVQATYVGGYTSAELDGTATAGIRATGLRMAAILTVVSAFKTADTQGSNLFGTGGALSAESVTTSGHSKTYDSTTNSLITGMRLALPLEAQRYAEPFVRMRR